MTDLKGKKILIFQQRGWAINIGHFLAKKLQAEGCCLAALTIKKSTQEFISSQKEVSYDLIIGNDDIMGNPKKYLGGDNYSLEEICEALGIDTIWPLVATVRNYVRTYKDKFYYGFKQNVSDEVITDYIEAVYKFILIFFNDFKPDAIIAPNIISLPHIMLNLYAKKQGIRMIAVTDSKINGYYLFAYDYLDSTGDFYDWLDKLNSNEEQTSSRAKARQYIKEFRQDFKEPDYFKREKKKTLKGRIRHELSPFYHILRWYLKPQVNVMESIGITLDYRPPRIILRDHWRKKQYRKFMDKYNYYQLEKIGKFVYFPLQFQPEAAIDVMAPYFSNQIETARQVAMSLPDDYTLVVKEHPSMVGLRPPSYIEKIARTPNVKLIDYRIRSSHVLPKADLVISPNSTTIAEAGFLKIPAIQLGNLGTTLKLPNVFRHTDMTTLPAKIKEVLKTDLDNEEYERRLENFVAAVFDKGIDFNYWGVWENDEKENMEDLWQVYKKEVQKAIT